MILKKIFCKSVEKNSFLIVGLGNPGREYTFNRHNIGFRVLGYLAESWKIPVKHIHNQALIGRGNWNEYNIILAKPQTYMNLSGQAVSSLVHHYQVPLERLLVIYDDLDLPLGTLRMRSSGGAAGHKGMASIIQKLGCQEFPRLRLGIGRPRGRLSVEDYVLRDFTPEEEELLPLLFDRSLQAVETFLYEGIHAAMSQHNHAVL